MRSNSETINKLAKCGEVMEEYIIPNSYGTLEKGHIGNSICGWKDGNLCNKVRE
jgi:hypothetical protein